MLGVTAGGVGFIVRHVSRILWKTNGIGGDIGGKNKAEDSTSALWAGKT